MTGIWRSVFGRGRSGHDIALASDRLVFWIGLIGLALTGLITVWFGPESHAKLEAQVQQAARTALAGGDHGWASARAYGQRIDLSGAAPSEAALASATMAVRGSLGKGGVISGGVTKVTANHADVVPLVSPFAWGAIREDHQITLEGVAPSRASLTDIEMAARSLFGAPNVISRMTLATGVPEGVDWSATAIAGITALHHLERGSAELSDHDLIVSGSTGQEEEAQLVRDELAAIDTGASVSAFISGPAEWSARLANGELRFTGQVASAENQEALAQIATDFFAADFGDNTTVGTVGPWMNRISVALPHFARFQSGQIDVLADNIRISGNAAGSVLSFLREDMENMSDIYTVLYNVREIAPEITELAGVNLDVADAAEREASCQEAFTQIMSSNDILFETGLARISRESGETLDKLIAVTRRCSGLRIAIEGHTDATGRAADNRELSRERAEAVLAYFITREIERERLTAVGYGEENPVASNRTAAGRAQNRRIEFTVSSAEETQ